MVRAWPLEESELDERRLEKDESKRNYIELETLRQRTGVLLWQLNPNTYDEDGSLQMISEERGYDYSDEINISPAALPDFDEKMNKFATEHLHEEEEIRFVMDGSAYFDVRDGETDTWIRIETVKGDLLILPAAIYHRLTLDTNKYVKLRRLFHGKPVWSSHERSAEQLDCPQNYLQPRPDAEINYEIKPKIFLCSIL